MVALPINRDDGDHLLLTQQTGSLDNFKGAELSAAFISTFDIDETGGYPEDRSGNRLRIRKFISKQCDIYLYRQRDVHQHTCQQIIQIVKTVKKKTEISGIVYRWRKSYKNESAENIRGEKRGCKMGILRPLPPEQEKRL
jgi:hypothetical protein